MNRCGTCQHWNEAQDGRDGLGKCGAIVSDYALDHPADQHAHIDDLAYPPECGGHSTLTTRPDFGCALWEPLVGQPEQIQPPDLQLP